MKSEPVRVSYCVFFDLRAGLREFSGRELESLFHGPSGAPLNAEEARAHMIDLVASGHRFAPVGSCSSFDPARGCKGHESPMERRRT